MTQLHGLLGVFTMLAIALALSTNRRAISLRIVTVGVLLQLLLGYLLLVFPPAVRAFELIAAGVNKVISFSRAGTEFVFGNLADHSGPWGVMFAIEALPVIIYFSALMAVLYHLRLMQRVIAALAWCLRKTLGVTGIEALAMAANVFVGQTEAPLCVKPYIDRMTRSQLMTLMAGGFATIAGSVLAVYVGWLGGNDDATRIMFTKHLLTASIMSAPAAFVIAKIMIPETDTPPSETNLHITEERTTSNLLDAAATGATDGLRLALNVAAMLIAFVALLALVNWPIEAVGDWAPIRSWREANDIGPLSLQMMLGVIFQPIAWSMGVPWAESNIFGALLGEKIIVTEFIAYDSLRDAILADPPLLSSRSAQIATYALCGFANLPSLAIQIGGLSGIAPSRRQDFASLALRAMIAGALASWMTASIASIFIR